MSFLIAGASGLGALAGLGLSARWNWWRPSKVGLPVLMYHKVGHAPEGSQLKKLWVTPEMFRKQMKYLSRHGYQPITFVDLYTFWDKGLALPRKPVLITFDDGYLNNFTEAFPILREFGFRATLFVVTETVGGDNRWHDPKSEIRIPMVSWDHLKELDRAGWEIGSHTLHHHNLTKLDLKDVKIELEKSRQTLTEKLNKTPFTFAYPYGAGEDSPEIRALVSPSGYRVAVGVHAGKWNVDEIKQSPFNLPRVFVRGDDNMFDFHLQMTRGQSRL